MQRWFLLLLCVLAPSLAMAQAVPRIKGVLMSFDGKLLTVKTIDPEPMRVGLMPVTRIVKQEKRALIDIKPHDYVGATITVAKDGSRHAQEVHVLPDSLRGSSEGLFAIDNGHFMLGGTVAKVDAGQLSVDYRGASDAGAATCTGRAPRTGGCDGHADVIVAAGVPVTALVQGDNSLLVPGAVLAISILAGPDGHPVTPGITVEGMAAQDAPGAAPPPARAPQPVRGASH